MKNNLNRLGVVMATVAIAVFGGATAAMATTPTFDPAGDATDLFNSNWTTLIDIVKDMAPLVIGAGLVLTVIHKVVSSFSRGKAPRRIVG